MASSRHAIIAGAGIGGLTAALTLARAGLTVTLLEQAPALSEAGAGLQLAPNASGILAQFGILDRLVGLALAPDRLRVRSQRSGADIMRMPLGPVAELRWGAPTLVVHRGDLQRALLDRVAQESSIELRTGMSVAGFANSPQGVSVAVKNGADVQSLEADLLIGADGLHSRVRKGLGLGLADQPHYSGRTAWRAIADGRDAPDFALRVETSLWLGSHAHLVHYPLRQGALVNVVAITDDPWRGVEDTNFWSQPGEGAQLTRRFSGWHKDARQLLASVREWRRWPLFDRTPTSRWSIGRVALLGDAAHPMLPFFAQGAAQAIEDAAALGAAFTARGAGGPLDVQTALAAYEAKRVARAGRVQLASRRQGTIYHLPGPAALIRDLGMRSLSAENMMSRFDWLYRYGA
ncbi:MAG: monooxygenase FAD-binding [Hyphomicrobiales bacterium]|nr:monooxygenase FAD-binding [Hyphomicrobiales bacterium]